jgi:branched-chain amino acid aminotransferase
MRSVSNLFMVKNGILTPNERRTGITAEVVTKLCEKLKIKLTVTNLTPFMMFTADEAFFTGTAMEMVPIREANKRVIGDGKPGPVTKKLMAEFHKEIKNPANGTKI